MISPVPLSLGGDRNHSGLEAVVIDDVRSRPGNLTSAGEGFEVGKRQLALGGRELLGCQIHP